MRFRMTALALASLLMVPLAAFAANYQIDASHSSIEFSVRHLVAKSNGRFTDFSGTIQFDESTPEGGSVNVTIQTASVNTDNEDRDGHLRGEDFFDVENHPEITFKGKGTKKTDDGFEVTGILAMHGVEKEIVMPVEFLGAGPDPWGGERAGFYAELKIDRKDFGIVWNKGLDKGGLVLGEDVKIRISIEAMQPKEQPKEEPSGW